MNAVVDCAPYRISAPPDEHMRDFILSHSPWLSATPAVMLVLALIKLASIPLVKLRPNYVRSAWYFYFLLAFMTFTIGTISERFGAIDAKGEFHGAAGEAMNKVLGFVFSLNDDVAVMSGVVGLVLGPQFLSYLFSGVLSNCAGTPRFTAPIIKFALFSLAKSIVIASGVLLGMATLSGVSGWSDISVRQDVGLGVISLVILWMGFHFLALYAEITNTEEQLRTSPRVNRLQFIHDWMTRNNDPARHSKGGPAGGTASSPPP